MTTINANEVEINGIVYVPKGSEQEKAHTNTEGLEFVIVRSADAGVFAGYIFSRNGSEVKLVNSRRLWYWSGAASLSQLAMEGVKNPEACKFPRIVPTMDVLGVCEIIPCTEKCRLSVMGAPIWEM